MLQKPLLFSYFVVMWVCNFYSSKLLPSQPSIHLFAKTKLYFITQITELLYYSVNIILLQPGGSLVITTINQTALSYASAILGAEYILRLVRPGTHDWNKFVTVEGLRDLITQSMLLFTFINTKTKNIISFVGWIIK